jgi:hypothetical protein
MPKKTDLLAITCKSIVVVVAIAGIVVIEAVALSKGIDGKASAACVGVIALIVGVSGRDILNLVKRIKS